MLNLLIATAWSEKNDWYVIEEGNWSNDDINVPSRKKNDTITFVRKPSTERTLLLQGKNTFSDGMKIIYIVTMEIL